MSSTIVCNISKKEMVYAINHKAHEHIYIRRSSNDNDLIFQEPLLKSELFFKLDVAMFVASACMKCEAFITTQYGSGGAVA